MWIVTSRGLDEEHRLIIEIESSCKTCVHACGADIGDDDGEWGERFTTDAIEDAYRITGLSPGGGDFHINEVAPGESTGDGVDDYSIECVVDDDGQLAIWIGHPGGPVGLDRLYPGLVEEGAKQVYGFIVEG